MATFIFDDNNTPLLRCSTRSIVPWFYTLFYALFYTFHCAVVPHVVLHVVLHVPLCRGSDKEYHSTTKYCSLSSHVFNRYRYLTTPEYSCSNKQLLLAGSSAGHKLIILYAYTLYHNGQCYKYTIVLCIRLFCIFVSFYSTGMCKNIPSNAMRATFVQKLN